jgi:EAL domain-containing protein (putative c-di-GMP-specific phosphodiesterase class I)
VIAEGVERREQAAQLREVGCDLAQGHYFAKSMEPAQLLETLRKSAEARRLMSQLAV